MALISFGYRVNIYAPSLLPTDPAGYIVAYDVDGVLKQKDYQGVVTLVGVGAGGAQGPPGPVGPAGLTWSGYWIATQSYSENYAVGYGSASWWCILGVTGATGNDSPDIDTTHWTLLAAQGSPGSQGAQGEHGLDGPQGLTGPTGVTGSTGATGSNGTSGTSGSSGTSGFDGTSGTSGSSGTSGVQGPQGPEGAQGVEGPVGVSGLTWQGSWSNNSLYDMNDAVGYASASWWCVSTVSSTASVIAPDLDITNINWTLLAAQGSQGPMGAQGVQGQTGPAVSNLQKVITASYSLQSLDNNYTIFINNSASNIIITIPTGLTSNFECGFIRQGTGEVSFTPISVAVTLNSPNGDRRINRQNDNAYITKVTTSETYHLLGTLKT